MNKTKVRTLLCRDPEEEAEAEDLEAVASVEAAAALAVADLVAAIIITTIMALDFARILALCFSAGAITVAVVLADFWEC